MRNRVRLRVPVDIAPRLRRFARAMPAKSGRSVTVCSENRTELYHWQSLGLVATRQTSSMEEPGQRLRRVRERLRLRYRDVERASQRIASQHQNDEFLIGLSRLADIENKGTVPTVFRLYSLCAIYGLDFTATLAWYGVPVARLPLDAASLGLRETRPVAFEPPAKEMDVPIPTGPDGPIDFRKTSLLTRHLRRWGRLPISMVVHADLRRHRYGFIGADDWSMHPILPPGSFVQIDETRRRIAKAGWMHEMERPIYFVEHREGFRCGWCSEKPGALVVQPHPLSDAPLEIFEVPGEAEVIGQVVGVAMRMDLRRRRTHS